MAIDTVHVLIVHENLLICNIFNAAIDGEADIQVVGSATTVEEALAKTHDENVDVALISTKLPEQGTLTLLHSISRESPHTKTLVLGLTEIKEHVLRYVEAGAIGYVLNDNSLNDLVDAIRAARDGKAYVSPEIAAALMRRVSTLAQRFGRVDTISSKGLENLTARELEVMELLARNMSNPEIAEALFIEVGTVKNHVHSILEKLDLERREQAADYLNLTRASSAT
jgi:DNA-binding NarL/FixJ family response regulator